MFKPFSSALIVTSRAIMLSAVAWITFGIVMVFYWIGLKANAFTACILVSLPYLVLFYLSKANCLKNQRWIMLIASVFIGGYGSQEYCIRLIVNLSTFSGNVFVEVPIIQILAILIIFGFAWIFHRRNKPLR